MTDTGAEGWESLDDVELTRRWAVPEVHLYGSVGSTNDVARALAQGGAPAGTVVLAETQRRGRGRGGRSWASPPGRGVSLSMVLRPNNLSSPGMLPVLIGIQLAVRLERVTGSRTALKWPNDLVVDEGKLGGILCEASWEGDRPSFVVAGVGINVRPVPVVGMEGWNRPVSLKEVTGKEVERLHVADAVVEALAGFSIRVPERIPAADLASFEARDALSGLRVRVMDPGSGEAITTGDACGMDDEGRLLVRTESGIVQPIDHGTVRRFSDGGP